MARAGRAKRTPIWRSRVEAAALQAARGGMVLYFEGRVDGILSVAGTHWIGRGNEVIAAAGLVLFLDGVREVYFAEIRAAQKKLSEMKAVVGLQEFVAGASA
jgi:hypothetical protein